MISVPIDNILPLEDLDKNLPDLVKKTHGKDFYVFTRDNKPIVALIGVDYLEDLTENNDRVIEGTGPKQRINANAPIIPLKKQDDKFSPTIKMPGTKLDDEPKTDKPKMPIFPKPYTPPSRPLNNQPPIASYSKPQVSNPTPASNSQIPTITITPPQQPTNQPQATNSPKPAPQDTLLGISANGVMPPQNTTPSNKYDMPLQNKDASQTTYPSATTSINTPSTPPFLSNNTPNQANSATGQSPMSKLGITSTPVTDNYDTSSSSDAKLPDSTLADPADNVSPAQYGGDNNVSENPLATSTATNGMRNLNLNNTSATASPKPVSTPNSVSTPASTTPTTTAPNNFGNSNSINSTLPNKPASSPLSTTPSSAPASPVAPLTPPATPVGQSAPSQPITPPLKPAYPSAPLSTPTTPASQPITPVQPVSFTPPTSNQASVNPATPLSTNATNTTNSTQATTPAVAPKSNAVQDLQIG